MQLLVSIKYCQDISGHRQLFVDYRYRKEDQLGWVSVFHCFCSAEGGFSLLEQKPVLSVVSVSYD